LPKQKDMDNNLPDYFWADRLTLINHYPFPSHTEDRIFEQRFDDDNAEVIQRFNDLKRKCLMTPLDVREEDAPDPVWATDVWDGKVVIECETESGEKIFVGWFDNNLTIGTSAKHAYNRKPQPYKQMGA
jgi:hypothetical protein